MFSNGAVVYRTLNTATGLNLNNYVIVGCVSGVAVAKRTRQHVLNEIGLQLVVGLFHLRHADAFFMTHITTSLLNFI